MSLLLLVLFCQVMASADFFAHQAPCELELEELRRSVRMLENTLLIGAWKIDHMRRHKHFGLPQPSMNQSDPAPDSNPKTNPHRNTTEEFERVPQNPHPTAGNLIVHDKDCSELYDRLRPVSGFYRIRPRATLEPFLAYCDMEDGGGWTVIQRRRHGRVNFNRDWVDYRDGFGEFKLWNDEFWLGNELIHSLLEEGENLMKIDLTDWTGKKSHAMYNNFRVADEKDKYRLSFGQYSGRAGDALSGGSNMVEQWSASQAGMYFSTRDQDNDRFLQGSCAQENQGGWWYNRCHAANLNGKFYRGGEYKAKFDNGVVWGTWKGLWYSLRHTTMKVRPRLFLDSSLGSGAGPDG
ncbi:fibrinogen like 1B [Osmerus mordax]|uniref:fibrinogen like 1B n=1 Tax=Osmerus mordax TaxID=8014 RepID=UPI00350F79E3